MTEPLKNKETNKFIALLIAIATVVFLSAMAQFFYFRSEEVKVNEPLQVLFDRPAPNSQSAMEEIKKNLLDSEQFIGLEKNGDWPLDLSKIKIEKANPFSDVQPKVAPGAAVK